LCVTAKLAAATGQQGPAGAPGAQGPAGQALAAKSFSCDSGASAGISSGLGGPISFVVNNGGFGSSITTNGSTFTTIILQSGFYQIHFESITTNLSGNVGYPFISMPGAGGVWISVGGGQPGQILFHISGTLSCGRGQLRPYRHGRHTRSPRGGFDPLLSSHHAIAMKWSTGGV